MRAQFIFQPPKTEAENLKLFFNRFGGYTAFVRQALREYGYKQLPDLETVAKKTAKQNDFDTKDFDGTVSDGID
jgi:hypothetical protein